MPKQSAGLVLYRKTGTTYEILLVHPGGPFWAKKDTGSWSIPKGEFMDNEEPLAAAKREFAEELGMPAPGGDYAVLGSFKQPSGKVVHAFALETDCNLERFKSGMFEMEWPPRSGQKQEFPEVDKAAWTPFARARHKLVKGQVPLLETLAASLSVDLNEAAARGDETAQASLF